MGQVLFSIYSICYFVYPSSFLFISLSSQVVGCLCTKGFSGKFCEKTADVCKGKPCFRGVQCQSETEPGQFTCGECPKDAVSGGKQGYKCFEHGLSCFVQSYYQMCPIPYINIDLTLASLYSFQTCAALLSPSPATKMPTASAPNKTSPAHVSLALRETDATAQVLHIKGYVML